jgi:hypothetical protein
MINKRKGTKFKMGKNKNKKDKGNYIKVKLGPISAKVDLDEVAENLGLNYYDDDTKMLEEGNSKYNE